MKKLWFLMATCLPGASFAQDIPFSVSGKIGKLDKPAVIFLEKGPVTDSVYPVNGKFSFKTSVAEPMKGYLGVRRKIGAFTEWTPVYLEKGRIRVVSADKDSVRYWTISGTPMNNEYHQVKKRIAPLHQHYEQINHAVRNFSQRQGADNRAFMDSVRKERDAIKQQEKEVLAKYIAEHPSSLLSLFLLRDHSGGMPQDIHETERLFNLLAPAVRNTNRGKAYGIFIRNYKNTAIGAIAPSFSQKDTAGKIVRLEDFRGKFVLLDFWASWCMPCRAMNPELVRCWKKYNSKGFTVLSVSLDRDHSKWMDAIHHDQLTWTHVSDLQFWNNEVAKLYGIKSVPQSLLIGPDGRIIGRNVVGKRLDRVLDSALVAPGTFTLAGTIEKVNPAFEPAKIYLRWLSGKSGFDSAVIANGAFTFEGQLDTIAEARLELYEPWHKKQDTDQKRVFLQPGITTLHIRDSVENAIVKGNPLNGELSVYNRFVKEAQRYRATLDREYSNTPKETMKQKGYYNTHFKSRFDSAYAMLCNKQLEYLRQYPDSYFGIRDLADQVYGARNVRDESAKRQRIAELREAYKLLSDSVKASESGKQIKAGLNGIGNTLVGDPYVPFSLPGIDGKEVDLAAVVSSKKLVLIDFWGSWCHWCRDGHPHLKELYAKYRSKGFEIVAVAVEFGGKEKQDKLWRDAVKKDGIPWLHVLNDKAVTDLSQAYGVAAYPTKILVDNTGKIILRVTDDSERLLDKKLKELL